MAKFHMNPSTQTIGKCDADIRECKFQHYDSIKEAKDGLAQSMEHMKMTSHRSEKAMAEFSQTTRGQKVAALDRQIAKTDSKLKALDKEMRDAVKEDPAYARSQDWFNKNLKRRELMYSKLRGEAERKKLIPKEVLEAELIEEKAAREKKEYYRSKGFDDKKTTGKFSYHPNIEGKVAEESLRTLSALTGESESKLEYRIKSLMELEGISRTEAHVKAFQSMPLRSDRPLVSMNIEVAAPDDKGWVDNGPYSSIIQVSYVKRNPDGTVEETTFKSGLPENLARSIGTGAQDIHGISTEDVAGLKPFVSDEEKMNQLKKDLRGSVVLTHGASFMDSQLSHNVPGYAGAHNRGDVTLLDSKDITRLYVRNSENNTAESMRAAAGQTESPARGLDTAKANLKAVLRLKG